MSASDIEILPSDKTVKLPFDWGELTWFASGELKNSDTLTVGRCILKPGRGNPRHRHPNCTEILVVLSGKIRHTGPGGADHVMGPGDTVTIPENAWHNATNVGDDEAVLLITFSSANRETIGE